MEHFYKELPGENWFDYEELYSDAVSKFPAGAHFVEVGTWKGRSACYMAVEIINSNKDIQFDCVDTWQPLATEKDIPEDLYKELYGTFLNNIAPVKERINPVRGLSWEAAHLYADESLDFVFIDAAHDYESAKKDIAAWYPKVKKTGVIAGHDYHYSAGVKKAVHEFFEGRHTVIDKAPCWYIECSEGLFSVVIPTLWRSSSTQSLLSSLNSCTSVGEIFIINNASKPPPEYLNTFSKVIVYTPEVNQYVNPSWNIGVSKAKHKFIALCNDDIVFNTDIFKALAIPSGTLIGMSTDCYELESDSLVVNLTPADTRSYGFGCLMFFNKKDYTPIPAQLKIWYGDDYLFSTFKHTYNLQGLAISTAMSTTSKGLEFAAIIEQDKKNYESLVKPRLFDCFLYNGEAKMLNFRLHELSEVVDYFVIVEATHTFKGTPKKLMFNIEDYQQFKDKIIFVPCETSPVSDAWENEKNQRRYLAVGVAKAQPKDHDLLLLSDVDEIPDVTDLQKHKAQRLHQAYVFNQNFYYYNYSCRNAKKWAGSVLLNNYILKVRFNNDFELVRKARNSLPKIGNDYSSGGWHFSYFGDIDYIVNKIQEFSHQEYNNSKYTDREQIKKLIAEGKDLFLRADEKFEKIAEQSYLPRYLHLLDEDKDPSQDITFILAVQIDSQDRLDNLDSMEKLKVTFDSYRDIKGYVINLDRERWRYAAARKELVGLGFSNIERWSATDYHKEDVITEMRTLGSTRLDRFYNCAEMSCLLSHFRIFNHFLSGNDPYCLVFEDDVVAVPEFKELCDFNDIHYGEFDLLSFGGPYSGPDYASWKPGTTTWNTSNWEPLLEAERKRASHISNCCFWQSHAYMISRKGAYRLLQDYPAWGSSTEYRIPFMDVYMSSNRNIENKLVLNRNIENPAQYSIGDKYGDRFCGIMFQRAEFKSTILAANNEQ